MKSIYTIVAVVGLVAASAGAWWWQNKASSSAAGLAGTEPRPGVPGVGAGATPAAGATGSTAAAPSTNRGAAAGGPTGSPGGPGGPAPVEVAKAEEATLTDDIQAVGSLKSDRGVMLRPEVSGRIAKLGFANGAKVQRGQLLVQLDDTLQQAQLKQADAQASIARTRLQRNRELQGQGFVSQSAVDQSMADLQVADAQVALAQAQILRMKVMAPFSGTAGLRLVDEGDYVKDGADIVNIEDLSAITVQFALPERTLDRLRVGQLIDLSLDALPGRTFKGRVTALDSQVDANGRALQVLAKVDNTGALLKPGMFARPRVVFATRQGAVLVPEEALVPFGGRQLIFKLVDGANGQKMSQRLEVKIGLRLPGKVEILDGLKPGDTVITAGHSRLLRGDSVPVRVVDISKPGGGRPGARPTGAAAPGGSAASGAATGAATSAATGAAAGAAANATAAAKGGPAAATVGGGSQAATGRPQP